MKHISLKRLDELSRQAIISNPDEARHLRECQHCVILLRHFAEERRQELAEVEEDRTKTA